MQRDQNSIAEINYLIWIILKWRDFNESNVEQNFNYGLYQDVGDVWGKNNGQRQFYTMPNTSIPNKQHATNKQKTNKVQK